MWWLGALAAMGLAFGDGAAHALPISIVSHERSVAVDASASSSVDSDSATEADSAPATGPATLQETASAAVIGVAGLGDASQAGTLSADGLSGTGVASANANTDVRATDAFAQGGADSLYRVEFQATADFVVRLTGSVAAVASGSSDALSIIELASVDSTLDPLLLRFEAAPGETLPFDVTATLQAGLSYRVTAISRAQADALDDEGSNASGYWVLGVGEVPEPGTALLVACGLAVLGRRVRR